MSTDRGKDLLQGMIEAYREEEDGEENISAARLTDEIGDNLVEVNLLRRVSKYSGRQLSSWLHRSFSPVITLQPMLWPIQCTSSQSIRSGEYL